VKIVKGEEEEEASRNANEPSKENGTEEREGDGRRKRRVRGRLLMLARHDGIFK